MDEVHKAKTNGGPAKRDGPLCRRGKGKGGHTIGSKAGEELRLKGHRDGFDQDGVKGKGRFGGEGGEGGKSGHRARSSNGKQEMKFDFIENKQKGHGGVQCNKA